MKNFNLKKIIANFLIISFVFVGFANITLAAQTTPGAITFANPLTKDTVGEILAGLLNSLQGVIIVIAMIFIIVGAILYMTSAGNDSRMTTAKGAIFAAVVGLAIALAAPSFLKEIYAVMGENTTATGGIGIVKISTNILNLLLSLVGIIGVIMLVASGIMYLTAAGNEGQIDTAKKMTTWAIVGIVVALGALVIVQQVALLFM